ncbi:MAG TPA: undecaprenyldiphospho-muramoylpentapeptide beta-N-acetylglucosaminyltransferase [Bdellovibrionota bacterium]|jgi:UDP-N-acetylglucosamine--N-acetylmuramyl-(pentapeptide) pyrophosphoryl-undecaprenol N-acetylglucosamine transferase
MTRRGGRPFRIAFAGGGSGGHLYPQVAVAGEIRKLAPEAEIFFVSSPGSIEERLIPQSGYEVVLIPSGKLKGQSIFGTFKTIFALFRSIFVCLWILLSRRPDLIFSAGGYAGAPFLVLGSLLGVRCEILEQNRHPGLANRWMAKFCRRVYVNFAASEKSFGRRDTRVVGHPCRPEIEKARWPENEVKGRFTANPFRVFVFGGSQGAMGINRLVTAASSLLKNFELEILHQTGQADFERVKKEYEDSGFTKVKVEKFIFDMAAAFKDAHLVVCRAGASSLAELAAAGKAAILIPLVSKDKHQEFNAKEMEKLGAALTFLQRSLTGESLAGVLKGLYTDREKLSSLASKMGGLHQPEAALRIARGILEG